MSKIIIDKNKIIIDGHADDLETCNTLTNLCDELNKSDKFETVKYDSGYGEFNSIKENEDLKFITPTWVSIYAYDGTTRYAQIGRNNVSDGGYLNVTATGVDVYLDDVYYESWTSPEELGNFLGLSSSARGTLDYPVGSTNVPIAAGSSTLENSKFYVVHEKLHDVIDLSTLPGWSNISSGQHTLKIRVVDKSGEKAISNYSNSITFTK